MRAALLLIVIAGSLWTGDVACAQGRGRGAQASATETQPEAEARALFQAGAAALRDGRYQAALEHFTRSYELSGRPELLYNIGVAHDRLRHDREALSSFESYLSARPQADNRADVEARILVLQKSIADEEARARQAEVPTPEQTARAAEPEPAPIAQRNGADTRSEMHTPLRKKWWLWTAIGAGVVTAAVIIAVASTRSSSAKPEAGDNGVLVSTLVAR